MSKQSKVDQKKEKRVYGPGIFVPTLYFAQGLPYALVNQMSILFFKNLGANNAFIGMTSLLYLPWSLKFLWSPNVDLYGTKKKWLIIMQLVLAVLTAVLCIATFNHSNWVALAVILFAIAIASATQDVSIDGYYLDELNTNQQSFFVGIRNAVYKLALLFGSGVMVWLSGMIANQHGYACGWSIAFGICVLIFLTLAAVHVYILPETSHRSGSRPKLLSLPDFSRIFLSYFQQPNIVLTVFYILTFRVGDAFLLKMAQPFLNDSVQVGGLGLSTAQIGLIYGTVGTIFLLLGGLVGGWLIARDGIKRWLFPTAIAQNAAIPLYWWLAVARPELFMVAVVNSFEQFFYGLGVTAYTVFLLSTVKSQYKAAHYATASALMAVGIMVPGFFSGLLEERLGYANFFLVSFLISIPAMLVIPRLVANIEKSSQQAT